jgi:Peptidase family M23
MKRLVALLPVLIAFQAGAPPALAWTWPVEGPVLRPFVLGDDPYAGGQHRGVDIAGGAGAPVRSPATGAVSFAGTVPGGGRTVTVRTADGYSVTLVHLGSIAVGPDAVLREGDPVGTIGPSGDREHSVPYVHLGIRLTPDAHGYLDPLSFLPARKAAPPVVPAPPAEPAPAVSPAPAPESPAPPPPKKAPAPAPDAPVPMPPSVMPVPAPAPPAETPAPAPASAGKVPEGSRERADVEVAALGAAGGGARIPSRRASTSEAGRITEKPHRAGLPQGSQPAAFGPDQVLPSLLARPEARADEGASTPPSADRHLGMIMLAAAALAFGLATATALRVARRRNLAGAVSTDAAPAVLEDGAGRTAEDALVLGAAQENGLVFDRDLERVALGEPEPLPDLDRNDDPAQLVQMANDACRRRPAVVSPTRLHRRVTPRLSSRCRAKAVSAC